MPRDRLPLRPPVRPDIDIARAALTAPRLDRRDGPVGAADGDGVGNRDRDVVVAGVAPEQQGGAGRDVGQGGGDHCLHSPGPTIAAMAWSYSASSRARSAPESGR